MKIQEADRKRAEEQEQKRLELERKKEEVERKERELLERQLNAATAGARARAAKKAEQERLHNSRTTNIERLDKEWMERETGKILQKKKDAEIEFEKEQKYYDAARQRKFAREEEARQERIETVRWNAELDAKREEAIIERSTQRDIKELHRIDVIKTEAREELQSFLLNPAPVPLKQVLAGRNRPVPKVTELLAAHKDQREDLEILKNADIAMRALLKNQSLFQYVKDFKARSDLDRVRPPEPTDGDLGRGRTKGKRSGASPKGKTGMSSTMRSMNSTVR